jgi:oligopeptidase B
MRSIVAVALATMTAVVTITAPATVAAADPIPPAPRKIPHELTAHGDVRIDEYYWLRQRDNAEVIAYLEEENRYLEEVTAPIRGFEEALFAEIVGRLKRDDASVPEFARGYWYYTRDVPDGEYPLYCRREGALTATEQIMLDGNALAVGHDFFGLRGVTVSSGNDVVAFAVDTVGRRRYDWRFRDLAAGRDYPETIAAATANGAWAEDGKTFFYTRQDPQTLRSYQVWRHELGTAPAADVLVYQEDDDTYGVYLFKTRSREFLMIVADQTLSTEYRFLPAAEPDGQWRILQPRERDLEYSVDHVDDRFLIRTNLAARNFRLMECGLDRTGKEHWRERIAHREEVLLEDFTVFRDFVVVQERSGGLVRLRVVPHDGAAAHDVVFDEPTYAAYVVATPEFDTDVVRYRYSSLTTPGSTYDYDMRTRQRTLRKRDEVVGAFDPDDYATAYIHAVAADGAAVPISLVYRRGTALDGSAPCLLTGYGSYGSSMSARFRSPVLSLLDRGFVFAIAHVRGGDELGRAWYEDGKLLNKRNTFTDFIACGKHLVATGYADPQRLYASGGSAGGLLIGAVINLAPEMWHGVVAMVPFVDVVTTMLDETIPLTTFEYDEWGNPHERAYYEYMLSYSPYDNVTAQKYPNVLITTGLHDSQVQYFEPAKWCARLRDRKLGDSLVLMHTDLQAGHGGATGRYKRHRETARAYAFLLWLAGITE